MRCRVIVLDGTPGRDLPALAEWLTRTQDLRGLVKIDAHSSGSPDQMGPDLELLNVIVANTLALGSLIVSIAAWRDSRASAPTVHLERNTISIEVNSNDPEVVRAALAALADAPEQET